MKGKRERGKRILIVALLFSLVFSALGGRIVYLMAVNGSKYKSLALEQQTKNIAVPPIRGAILDRNGQELALSMNIYRLDVDLNVLKKYLVVKKIPEEQADLQLSKILNIDKSKIKEILDDKDNKGNPLQFVSLKRKVEKKVVDNIKALKYSGIIISKDVERTYPNDNFLSHVMGHTNLNGNGVNGVELSYNNELAGVPGVKVVEADRESNELPYTEAVTVQPVNGKDLTLTIDERVQELAQKVAKETLDKNGAKSVSITIMNPKNGEIMAMANAPDYNLNIPYVEGKTSKEIQEIWKNRAIGSAFEPGSIFKVITSAAALQNNAVTEKDRFISNGSIKVGNKLLYSDNKENYGIETFSDIIKNSDNVGFVKLGQMIGKANLYKFIELAGFGQKTNIDMPGEGTGIVKDLNNITPIDLATMAYGQGVAVTQIQYIAAFNAVANGGTWIRPHVMKDISHMENGKKVIDKQFSNLNEKTIMDKEKATQLRTYLERVVKEGTAVGTYIDGYHIAGKTGTANKVNSIDGGYNTGKYVSSFAGMAPASDPKVSLVITIEEPNASNYYAAQTAVPAARKLFLELFPIINMAPSNVSSTKK
ncbi:penicillin-binding protein 2 [Clostridium estertheticum]|nr:penicillin-binding transpeptidase domain-containing protein [Clostridium estertheticum]MCB2307193.1 penicillin-binding protein 2 [Clostridium estertheticum]MCB2344121.1 penicillin-binding protein 2 [Clostridium estertheticum]MCB2348265.1 penicillin-binding protein 2 [Clostridium estertheticum]WAG45896.1 penicillin-binding protein 2 [Clostridium estertheticum]